MKQVKSFRDKVAIVTGSSRGIGKATAIALAKSGASVVLNGRNPERLLRTEEEVRSLGAKVLAVCGDVSNPDHARTLVERSIETFGTLHILINNAGVSMRGDISELNPEVFRTVFDTNVFGVINMVIPALPYIRESGGSIVFVSSVAAVHGMPGLSAYCSSKMALRPVAESLRIEEANSGIHVGLIFVGVTEIDPMKKIISADGSLVMIKDRSDIKLQLASNVARSILNNIRKRKYKTVLTGIGKLNAAVQPFMPGLVEQVLLRTVGRIR